MLAVLVTLTVPLPFKVPAPLIISAAAGVKTEEALPELKVPATAKLPLPVTDAPLAIVRL